MSSSTQSGGSANAKDHYQVLIVGGGAAGISVAARLRRGRRDLNVAIVEPSERHYYQPLWTLVGGGAVRKETTERAEASLIPKGTTWVRDAVAEFMPKENAVVTAKGTRLTYDFLVVAPGIQLDWSKIPGLAENIGTGGLCSNYSIETVDSTWEAIRNFKGGTAIFTHPNTPIKCGGAPQKIMYLAADYWSKHPPPADYKIVFCIATPTIFAVEKYANRLLEVIERYGIEVRFQNDLTAIDAAKKEARFVDLASSAESTLNYDLLHVTPPMSAPDFVKSSPLSNSAGWVDVDKYTLQHVQFSNVFGLGDASALPTSKTGAAVRKQAPVVAANVLAAIDGRALDEKYNGYTSCPLITGYGKLVMAEFDYELKPQETFPVDQGKERRSMYLIKKYLLPQLYWKGMLKGRA